jgi:CRISPR/Cas system Type II protein with McrA/HNH and RuvC-like nuclease domain
MNNLLVNTNSVRYKNNNRHKQYFLEDSAYDTKEIRDILKQKGLHDIIPQNIKKYKGQR